MSKPVIRLETASKSPSGERLVLRLCSCESISIENFKDVHGCHNTRKRSDDVRGQSVPKTKCLEDNQNERQKRNAHDTMMHV